jgi:molybdopterin-guanine dinucleotide biosynthesis protein A
VAWDMPFVPASLIAALAAGLAGRDAYLPASGGPREVEPLCAGYGPACGPAVERAAAEGDRRAIGFHRYIRVGIMAPEEVRRHGEPARLFFNVNTAADLARAQEM